MDITGPPPHSRTGTNREGILYRRAIDGEGYFIIAQFDGVGGNNVDGRTVAITGVFTPEIFHLRHIGTGIVVIDSH